MNFENWAEQNLYLDNPLEQHVKSAWDSCKNEMLKVIKSKYPNYVGDKVYEDGWDTACMSIEEEVEKL